MERKSTHPIYLITEPPKGWISATHMHLHDQCDLSEVRDTVLVMPIHNEQKTLQSAIGSLMISGIPRRINAVYFVTNACTDQSAQMVRSWFDFLLDTEQAVIDEEKGSIRRINYHDLTLCHIDTATPGKANAINSVIQQIPSTARYLINLDANNYLEPGALSHLLTATETSDTIYVAQPEMVRRKRSKNSAYIEERLSTANWLRGNKVHGWLFALDLNWLRNSPDPTIPEVAIEDYAIGVKAEYEQQSVVHITTSKIWGFSSNNIRDRLKQKTRYIRGRMQMHDKFPHFREILLKDTHYLRLFPSRLLHYFAELKQNSANPKTAAKTIAKAAFDELAIILATIEYHKAPHNQSWEPINSTK